MVSLAVQRVRRKSGIPNEELIVRSCEWTIDFYPADYICPYFEIKRIFAREVFHILPGINKEG